MKEFRSYKEAFESGMVNQISELIESLEQRSRGKYGVYTSEIQGCLLAGLLLAAVSVSCALLGLFIRDLMVMYVITRSHGGDVRLRSRIERQLEADRDLSFSKMLIQLQQTVIEAQDAAKLQEFYDRTQIPFAHALMCRMTTRGRIVDEELDDLLGSEIRHRRLEEQIEDKAIGDLEFAISFIEKYLPWLLRRYRVPDGDRRNFSA